MYSTTDDKKNTGIPFIDENHHIIQNCINELCEDIAVHKEIDQVLEKVDTMIQKIEPYLETKAACQQRNACQRDIYAHHVIQALLDLRTVISQFGQAMSPAAATTEIRQWAKLYIFEEDLKCSVCARDISKKLS
ncbi:MAG: hypothetical protein HWE34_19080 [Methylocystaceae bacterium]|nr:hypothetical protein [Methylocystaceae bacterium]